MTQLESKTNFFWTPDKVISEPANASAHRVWRELARVFGHDLGVLFELFYEPRIRK
jgi:hypothetical protein